MAMTDEEYMLRAVVSWLRKEQAGLILIRLSVQLLLKAAG